MNRTRPKENKTSDGITVEGSISSQEFCDGYVGILEENSSVIVFKLIGQTSGRKITKSITVKTKFQCVTCGKKHRSNSKFCSECGTSLEII
jgi:hypothetical protein